MRRAASEAEHISAPDDAPHPARRFFLLPKGRPHMLHGLAGWWWGLGGLGSAPLSGSPDADLAVQAEPRPPPPHSRAEAHPAASAYFHRWDMVGRRTRRGRRGSWS